MTTYHGTTVKLVIERLSDEGKIAKEYLGDLDGGAADQDFYTKNFPITWDAGEAGEVTGAVVDDVANSDTTFETDLTEEDDDYYVGMTIRFTSGGNDGEMRVISDYVGSTKFITVASAFTGEPAAEDTFIIEPSVDVFTDDGSEGSWTEYEEDGTDYTIDGPDGKVTVLAAENQAGNADEHVCISYYTSAEVGMGQSASIEFDGSLEETYKLGDRDPQDLKAGLKTISGTIAQLYASRDLIGKFLGESDFYEKLTDFTVYLYPNGETAGQPQIKLTNVKFSGGSISVSVDSIMAADVSFKGLAIEIGTVPE